MKVGIVMTIKDRPELTKQSLIDLVNSDLPEDCVIVLVDDGGKDCLPFEIIRDFKMQFTIITHLFSKGVKESLREGIDLCWKLGCDVVTNLDNDVRLRRIWLTKLLEMHSKADDYIITGFHSTTKNLDGTERHKITRQGADYCFKESVGGINMMFNKTVYEKYILPALSTCEGNWDHIACINSYNDGHSICVAVPSLIQHTGINFSSMGHSSEPADVAADWINLELKDVMLFGLDDREDSGLKEAMDTCQREIKFGDVLRLNNPVDGKKGYSEFMIHHLHHYVHTSHVLVVQADGYIINPQAWDNDWLQYDYIGATWLYKDGMNVGNGGFSLRSSNLCKIINDLVLNDTHPEDFIICRQQRKILEERFGIKFAPEDIANKFSIEAFGVENLPGANLYSGQFGFHGWSVDFTGWHGQVPVKPKRKYDKVPKRYIFDNF